MTIDQVQERLDALVNVEPPSDGAEQAIQVADIAIRSIRETLERSQDELEPALRVLRRAGYLR